jgi:hypothetical protein
MQSPEAALKMQRIALPDRARERTVTITPRSSFVVDHAFDLAGHGDLFRAPAGDRKRLHAGGGRREAADCASVVSATRMGESQGLPFAFVANSQGDPLREDGNQWDDDVMLVTVLLPQGVRMDVAAPGLRRDVVTEPTGAMSVAAGEPLDSSGLAADYRSVATRAPLCPCAEAANAGRALAGFRLR